jgi:hypothetical protein
MRIRIGNEGEQPVRVIVDGDTVNDQTLDVDAETVLEGEVIELRALEEGTQSAGDEDTYAQR